MTSIFDQYNNTLKREEGTSKMSSNDPPSSGYVTIRTKEEAPIFTKQKMKLNLPEKITHLTVSNNWLVCLMSHQVLLRLFLPRPDLQDEVFLEKYLGAFNVSKLFLDPTGNHLLISLSPKSTGISPELLYLHTKTGKPKRIDKFKDHEITAVAFNYTLGSEISTGPILLGTSRGLIIESEFGIEGEKLVHNNWKQIPTYLYGMREHEGLVFDIGREKQHPITDISFFKTPNANRYIVLATITHRLYTFHAVLKPEEKFSFQSIFTSYLNIPEECEKNYLEIKSDIKLSKLRFNMDIVRKFPNKFGWLTGPGISHGEVDQNAEFPEFLINEEKLLFAKLLPEAPKSFILTEYHAVLLYPDHVTAVCLLNKEIIYEEYFAEQYGHLLDIVKDSTSGAIYVYSPNSIFRYKVTKEQRNVWKMYLERDEFDLAIKYSRDNPAHLDIVLCKQAEMCFNQKDYLTSASVYSETQTSFEKVCLKFLELPEKGPLMLFLNNRLEKLKDEDKTQITMLVVWMVELYLTEMARNSDDPKIVRELQKDFENFMAIPRVVKCVRVNRSVFYDLMGSHGDSHNLTMLTTVNKDYESVINQYINQGFYFDALAILRSQEKPDLYYKYSPILMEEIPHETISAIIAQEKLLNPVKLLPTLICLDSENHITEVIRYLEFAIYSMAETETSIHNFLIKLYTKYKQDKLETYLETQGRDISLIHYDVHYALRVCEEHNAQTACVFLQCMLELWHPAVELALTFNSRLAQETASKPSDPELRRKLWLRIAEHEIKGNNDVKKALELLKECDLLRIEDLLPYFADFQKIDDFKEAICDALKDYNMKIQEQQRDMEESAKSAERVRNELQNFRNQSVTIGAQEQCAICEIYLLAKPFFIFPCGHKFHGDCLEKQIISFLTPEQHRQLTSKRFKLESMQAQANSETISGYNAARDKLKAEIESVLAADCLYCGLIIDTIDQPFIEDWDQVNVDWQ